MILTAKDKNPESLNSLIELYLDDALSDEQGQKLDQLLQSSALARTVFMERTTLATILRQEYYQQADMQQAMDEVDDEEDDRRLLAEAQLNPIPVRRPQRKVKVPARRINNHFARWFAAAAALSFSTLIILYQWQSQSAGTALVQIHVSDLDGAYFEKASLTEGTLLESARTYVLQEGEVQLSFKNSDGVTETMVRLRGPSTFETENDRAILLSQGQLSVHVIDSDLPFTVKTHDTNIVDLGTKFSVLSEKETGTRVQVSEGMVDVYEPITDQPKQNITAGKAFQFAMNGTFTSEPATFQPSIDIFPTGNAFISFKMEGGTDGKPATLASAKIRRNGQVHTVAYDNLIQSELISYCYKNTQSTGFITPDPLPADRLSLWSDDRLDTGIYDIDGSNTPLTQVPNLEANGSPGVGIRFKAPVTNQPGPDLLLFVSSGGIEAGKAIHVSPMVFMNERRTFTVSHYVVDRALAQRRQPKYPVTRYTTKSVSSIEALTSIELAEITDSSHICMATSIDLSDLGYQPGEQVDSLFLQDALDDDTHADIVMLVGLPPLP